MEYPRYNNKNNVIGTDKRTLVQTIMGYIPKLEHLSMVEDEWEIPNKYAILDLIQFCYNKIHDIVAYDTDFYGQDVYTFSESQNKKEEFRQEINQLLERNKIVFYLDTEGMIKRHLPLEMEYLIEKLSVRTNDEKLNQLINLAIEKIHNPKENDRIYAVEKIWDAFERMKTYYEELNKKESANLLVQKVSLGTEGFYDFLNNEFTILRDIGNNYQIRHFEKGKIPIKKVEHIDYLFYRMIALISLCLNELN